MLKIVQTAPRELTHQRIFNKIGKFLADHGLCPSPENYSLVYRIVVDSDSPLSREVRRIAASSSVRPVATRSSVNGMFFSSSASLTLL